MYQAPCLTVHLRWPPAQKDFDGSRHLHADSLICRDPSGCVTPPPVTVKNSRRIEHSATPGAAPLPRLAASPVGALPHPKRGSVHVHPWSVRGRNRPPKFTREGQRDRISGRPRPSASTSAARVVGDGTPPPGPRRDPMAPEVSSPLRPVQRADGPRGRLHSGCAEEQTVLIRGSRIRLQRASWSVPGGRRVRT